MEKDSQNNKYNENNEESIKEEIKIKDNKENIKEEEEFKANEIFFKQSEQNDEILLEKFQKMFIIIKN